MRTHVALSGCILFLVVSPTFMVLGCNRGSGGALGNSSATGDSADQGGQKPQAGQQKKGAESGSGQSGNETSQPAASVSGQPSAASDRGSADAVAHRSVAQPGAPQGTVPQTASKSRAATQPPPQR